jgi:hypothetical protein
MNPADTVDIQQLISNIIVKHPVGYRLKEQLSGGPKVAGHIEQNEQVEALGCPNFGASPLWRPPIRAHRPLFA